MVVCAILVFGLAAVALVSTVLHLLYNYTLLKSIPGPILASVSDLWTINDARHFADLHQAYGDVVRLGPNVVSLRNVGDIARVVKQLPQPQRTCRQLGGTEEAVRDLVQTIRQHRIVDITTSLQFIADEFMNRLLPDYTAVVPETRTQFQGQTQPTSSLFTTIEELLLRGPVSLLKRERLSCYTSPNTPSTRRDVPDPIFIHSPPTRAIKTFSEILFTTTVSTLKETFVSAIPLLLRSPKALCKLRREIDDAVWFPNRKSETYLDAVVNETMRLVLLSIAPQEIKTDCGLHLSSMYIPPGTTITYYPYVILTNASQFGSDIEAFRPERWLTTDQENRRKMNEALLPVSVVLDQYLELEHLWMELKQALVVLLQAFQDTEEQKAQHGLDIGADSLYPQPTLVDFQSRPLRPTHGV
ncbi:cytochrome P450 [Aspergillus karnatakaensis]|uniref:putative cytochrome P450 monooxygenase n=1 Tax=Aspergillus karnatakaensis TaxID=1810916 RepID=UPI003CCCE006